MVKFKFKKRDFVSKFNVAVLRRGDGIEFRKNIFTQEVIKLLYKKGFIRRVESINKEIIRVYMAYSEKNNLLLRLDTLKTEKKYYSFEEIRMNLKRLKGDAIYTTSKGILLGSDIVSLRGQKIGGELLFVLR